MNSIEIKEYCLSKKGAYEDYPFGPEALVMKVESKIFAIISDKQGKISISLKCDPILAQNLRYQYKAVTPGYHLNKEHWNTVFLDGSIPDSEIFWMIDHSYEIVVNRLTREERSKICAIDLDCE
jgi:predicted DNA-binding protein (MmcQ/YjbR family)